MQNISGSAPEMLEPVASPICGIIMPISAMPPKYDTAHWADVRKIIEKAILTAEMRPQIVSDSFESDVIQSRIINNLYDNPVVVCDVSGLNANVMFELGMRITFKQPVVIITDDVAAIPFDTRVIEHLTYPSDLHIHQTNEFIEKLSDKIKSLYLQKSTNTFRSFIEEFGTFEVLEPTKKVVEADQFILDRLGSIESAIQGLSTSVINTRRSFRGPNALTPQTIQNSLISDIELINAYLKSIVDKYRQIESFHVMSSKRGKYDIIFTIKKLDKALSELIETNILAILPDELLEKITLIDFREP